jgi:hypothetical protein
MCDQLRTSSWTNTSISNQKDHTWYSWSRTIAAVPISFSDNKKNSGIYIKVNEIIDQENIIILSKNNCRNFYV